MCHLNMARTLRALCFSAVVSLGGIQSASAYEWSGFYVGVQGGGVFGDSDVEGSLSGESRPCIIVCFGQFSPYEFGASDKVDLSGASAGIAAGYNFQIQNFILGAEVDINGSDADTGQHALFSALNDFVQIGNFSTELEWFGSARARLGYQISDGLMVYGTGGFAFGRVKNSIGYNVGPAGDSYESSSTETGWTAGGGMEMQLFNSPKLRLKAEYLYTDLGSNDFFHQDLPDAYYLIGESRNNEANASSDLTFQTVRVGVVLGF